MNKEQASLMVKLYKMSAYIKLGINILLLVLVVGGVLFLCGVLLSAVASL